MAIAVAINDIQKVPVTLSLLDAGGQPAGPVADLAATSTDPATVDASVDADGMLWIASVGPQGTATVTASAPDPDTDGATLSVDFEVVVGQSDITGLGVAVGEPENR